MYIAVFGRVVPRLDLPRLGLRSLHPPQAFVAATFLRLQHISVMSAGSSNQKEKKGHICMAVDAKHPSERWETAFVYVFITKFTNLRQKVEGFENVQECAHPWLIFFPYVC